MHVGDRELAQKISLWQHRQNRQPIDSRFPGPSMATFCHLRTGNRRRDCSIHDDFAAQMAAEFSIRGPSPGSGDLFPEIAFIKNELQSRQYRIRRDAICARFLFRVKPRERCAIVGRC